MRHVAAGRAGAYAAARNGRRGRRPVGSGRVAHFSRVALSHVAPPPRHRIHALDVLCGSRRTPGSRRRQGGSAWVGMGRQVRGYGAAAAGGGGPRVARQTPLATSVLGTKWCTQLHGFTSRLGRPKDKTNTSKSRLGRRPAKRPNAHSNPRFYSYQGLQLPIWARVAASGTAYAVLTLASRPREGGRRASPIRKARPKSWTDKLDRQAGPTSWTGPVREPLAGAARPPLAPAPRPLLGLAASSNAAAARRGGCGGFLLALLEQPVGLCPPPTPTHPPTHPPTSQGQYA